jgi:hypothetical protein
MHMEQWLRVMGSRRSSSGLEETLDIGLIVHTLRTQEHSKDYWPKCVGSRRWSSCRAYTYAYYRERCSRHIGSGVQSSGHAETLDTGDSRA